LVVITSDKGLAGALNSSVLKQTAIALRGYERDDVTIFAYGRKAEDYFKRRGYRIPQAFENKKDDVEHSIVEELSRELSREFVSGAFDQVIAVYSNFKSTFEQMATARVLLPLSVAAVEQLVKDIIPEKGKFSELRAIESPPSYSVESDTDNILDVLAPRLVAASLYHMMLESKASEHSARMVAMKSASDKSKEVAHDLTRLYNKIRQAAITREVSEIVSGREALAA
jgi:F-type H+-transporting ATPase subunit gamma